MYNCKMYNCKKVYESLSPASFYSVGFIRNGQNSLLTKASTALLLLKYKGVYSAHSYTAVELL